MTVRDFSPAAVTEAQRLYEQTDASPDSIAGMLGISRRTLYNRAKLWGWRPRGRNAPGSAVGRMPVADEVSREKLIARLVARVEAEISAVERLIARAGWQNDVAGSADTERAARTLAVLVRSLRELAAIERDQAPDNEEAERDADAYRRELEATLERVLAGGAAA